MPKCDTEVETQYMFHRSIGTLGGGNHFVELDRDKIW